MDIDHRLKRLSDIQKVPAPSTLYARIEKELKTDTLAWNWSALAAAIALLILLNATVLYKFRSKTPSSDVQLVASAMHLSASTAITYE